MNATAWSDILAKVMPNGFTYGEMMHLYKEADVAGIFRIKYIHERISGPALWTVCIVGIVLNSLIILSGFFMKWSSSLIMLEAISILSIVKSGNLLHLQRLVRGNS